MENVRTGIISECVCDLPKEMLNSYNVDVIYFLIETDSGVFTDTDEITADNVISYMEASGGKAQSLPPPVDVYKKYFEKKLKKYDEVVFISISSQISRSYETAELAVKLLGDDGKRVRLFDSEHLSTGLGFLVINASEMAQLGFGADEIVRELEVTRKRISTTFLAHSPDYLHRNGHISSFTKRLCEMFSIHPVLTMKNGRIAVKTLFLGNYETACRNYIRSELKQADSIDKKRAFITHVGCSVKTVRSLISEAEKYCPFKKLEVTRASATISGNCGKGTFGILFIRND